jgi:hypothetical protein
LQLFYSTRFFVCGSPFWDLHGLDSALEFLLLLLLLLQHQMGLELGLVIHTKRTWSSQHARPLLHLSKVPIPSSPFS